jgi:tetratricopeptide (TPR) repeat protein
MTSSTNKIITFFGVVVFSVLSMCGTGFSQTVPTPKPLEAAPASPGDFNELIKSAFDLYEQEKYDEAIAMSVKAAGARPADFRPHYVTGLSYSALWKMKSASEAFGKAISRSPGNIRLYYLKAVADRNRNAGEEGAAAARKAIEMDPTFAEAYYTLGELLAISDEDTKGAIEAWRTAIKLKPKLFDAYFLLGMHLAVAGDVKGAEEVYRKAMDIDPRKMACRFALGRLLVKENRLAEARVVWNERSHDKDTTFPNFITVLERAERLKQATDNLAQKPNDPDALLQMGLMVMEGESYSVDGRQERAIVYFRKALAKKPGFAKAQYAICKAYVELADFSKDKNKNVDEELAKLKKMHAKLADEIVEYRKNYSGPLKGYSNSQDQ